jgi:hypothetical protein
MSSLVYILRSPPQHISLSLYSPDDPHAVVLGIEGTGASSYRTEVLKPGGLLSLKTGQALTNKEFLHVIMNTKKVITL